MGAETFRTIRERGGFGAPLICKVREESFHHDENFDLICLEVFIIMKTFSYFWKSFNYNENGEYKI